jgi:LysM repeat protein
MNDDLLNFNGRPEREPGSEQEMHPDKSGKTRKNSGLSTIFLVVLGLHVAVIVGIGAFHLIRGNSAPETVAETPVDEMPVADPASAPVAEAYAPEGGTAPAVQGPVVESSMPLPNDPLWTGQPAVTAPAAKTPVVEAKPVPAPAVSGRTHTVVSGDSLFRIARQNGVKVDALKQANGLTSDLLRIGQTLVIPTGGQPAAAAAPVSRPAATGQSGGRLYEVVAGDTLVRIARNFGTTADKIAEVNGITDPRKLKIGMKLWIPSQTVASETSSVPARTPQPQGSVQNTDMAMLQAPAQN